MRSFKRRIEAAVFENLGIVQMSELLKMDHNRSGHLRDWITQWRQGQTKGLKCRCMACGHPVFITAKSFNGVNYPLFSHFAGQTKFCPWHSDPTKNPDAVRALQYQGQQESIPHRFACEQIASLCRLDPMCTEAIVNAYRPPTKEDFGRYPDVLAKWTGIGEIVFEVQLSNTFQTEIADRVGHYENEGTSLIWVLFGVDPSENQLKQSFKDVIRRHRGNAFVLDQESIEASMKHQTIMLKCYLEDDQGSFGSFHLVGLSDLNFGKSHLPFYKDRVTEQINRRAHKARQPCFKYLNTISGISGGVVDDTLAKREFMDHIRRISPDIPAADINEIIHLIALIFSAIASVKGSGKLYGSAQANISAMINSSLTRYEFKKYANVVSFFLENSAVGKNVNKSVGEHISRAMKDAKGNLCLDQEPEWQLLSQLVPEVFDPITRKQLGDLSELPVWAVPTKASPP